MDDIYNSKEITFTPVSDTDESEWEAESDQFRIWFDTKDAETLKKDTGRIAIITIQIGVQTEYQFVSDTTHWRLHSEYRGIGKVEPDGRITWEDNLREMP